MHRIPERARFVRSPVRTSAPRWRWRVPPV